MGRIEKVVDEHVASISHDLKNPLSVIAIDVQTLEDQFSEQVSPDARHALRRIAKNVAFMDRVIRELLDLSAIDCHRLDLRREPADLARLVSDIIDRSVPPAERERVCFQAVEPARVLIDVTRIERVIANLVENALHYAPGMPVVVRVDALAGLARVSVIDLGPGLDERDLASLFTKHQRARTNSRRDGAGLGLYVSRKIVEAHEGRIGGTSRVGRGSTFYFELPLYED